MIVSMCEGAPDRGEVRDAFSPLVVPSYGTVAQPQGERGVGGLGEAALFKSSFCNDGSVTALN